MHTATKEFRFEAGHCLDQHPGKCKNLHGHNQVVLVTLGAKELNEMEMVEDFYNIATFAKPFFEAFDHAFIYNVNATDSFEHEIAEVCRKHDRKVVRFPFRATAENMAEYFYKHLNEMIGEKAFKVIKVTVYETASSFSTYEE